MIAASDVGQWVCRLVPPDPLPVATRRRASRGMGLDRPELSARDGPAVLAAAGHGPRAHDDACRPTCAGGRCSGCGGTRRRWRRSSRARRSPRRWRLSPRSASHVRLEPMRCRGALGRWQPARRGRRAARPRRRGPVAVLTRASIRPRRRSRSTARSPPPARELLGAPGLLASVGIGEWPLGAPGDVLALARSRGRDALRVRRRPRTRRSSAAPAPRAGTPRSCSRAFGRTARAAPGTDAIRLASLIASATVRPPSTTSGRPPPGWTVPPASTGRRTPRTRFAGRLSVPSRPWGAAP